MVLCKLLLLRRNPTELRIFIELYERLCYN